MISFYLQLIFILISQSDQKKQAVKVGLILPDFGASTLPFVERIYLKYLNKDLPLYLSRLKSATFTDYFKLDFDHIRYLRSPGTPHHILEVLCSLVEEQVRLGYEPIPLIMNAYHLHRWQLLFS